MQSKKSKAVQKSQVNFIHGKMKKCLLRLVVKLDSTKTKVNSILNSVPLLNPFRLALKLFRLIKIRKWEKAKLV